MKLFTRFTGIVTFLIFFILALLFYKERTLTLDVAFQNFNFIMNRTLNESPVRYGAIIPQLAPLTCRWLDCPLKVTLLVHSAGFVLFYFSFFFILVFIWEQYWTGIVYLLFLLLWVNDTFYWIPSEIPQGIAYLLLYYGYLEKTQALKLAKYFWAHLLALAFIQFLHPLLVAPILFVILYAIYKRNGLEWRAYIFPLLAVVSLFGLRYYAGTFDWYEGPKLAISQSLHENLPLFFHLPAVRKIIHYSTSDYLLYWLVFFSTAIILLSGKRFYPLVLFCSFSIGYFVLVCVTNPVADKFYLENMLLPLSIFLLLPFTDFVLKRIALNPPVLALVIWGIIAIRILFIYNSHTAYTARIAWYEKELGTMQKNHTPKIIFAGQEVPMDTLIMTWASGYESLLISSLDGPNHSRMMVINGDTLNVMRKIKSDSAILPTFNAPTVEIRKHYFSPPVCKFVVVNK